jgi:hypothetical protein
MTDSSHTISIAVDASRGLAGLNALRQAVQTTSRDLQALGSAGGGSAFASLSRGLADTSRGFSELKRQTSDSGLSNLSREISMLSRGMPVLAREIIAVGSSLIVSRGAVAAFASALAGAGVAEFGRSIQDIGNRLTSFRLSIDAVSTSSDEAEKAFQTIRNAAQTSAAPLSASIEGYKQLYSSMRPLGFSIDAITRTYTGFSKALTAMHVSAYDARMVYKELGEAAAQGAVHARIALLALGSHIPGMASIWQQAMGMNGSQLHEQFRKGGLPVDALVKAADILAQRFGPAVQAALKQSTANITLLTNAFEALQQSAYDNGFDSGLSQLLQKIRGGLDSLGGADAIGRKIGEGFRIAFTSAALLLDKLIQLKEPITTIGGSLLAWSVATSTVRLLAGAVALLFTPLGAAAAGAVLLATSWENLKSVFSGGDKDFNAGSDAISRLTGGWVNFSKAALGAVEAYTLAKNLIAGKGWDESKRLASEAGGEFLRGEFGKRSGNSFADSFVEGASTLFGKLDSMFGKHLPGAGLAQSIRDEWTKLYKASDPTAFHGGGSDYAANAARYAKPDLSLSEEIRKVWERLVPANKALLEFKSILESIQKMRGREDPLTGKLIDDSAIKRMTAAARADAFESAFPMANKIQEKLDELRAASDLLGSKSGKTSFDAEREVLREVNALKRKGVEIRDDEVDALRKIVTLEKELQKGGSDALSQWAHNQKSQIESMNDAIKGGLDSFADGIAKIATEGKGKFKSLGEAIRSEMSDILRGIARNMISSSIKSLVADGIKSLDIGGMKGKLTEALGLGQGVVDKANATLDSLSSDALKNVAEMSVNAGIVNLNASGLTGFSPSGFNANAVGGVEPKSATESLFAGNALASRDQSITPNSVQAFAQILAPWKKGDAPNNITSNSVAEFAKIANLQNPVSVIDSAGLTLPKSLPSFGKPADLESLFKNAGLSSATEKALKTVNPDLQGVILRAQELSGTKIAMNGLMGARTAEQQNALFRQNRPGRWVTSKDGFNNPSNHQSGNAADVTFADANGRLRWGKPEEYENFNRYVQQAARERGVAVNWGGNWKTHRDIDHWEIARGSKPTPVNERSFTSYAGSNVDEFKRASKAFEQEMKSSSQKVSADFTSKLDSAIKQPADLLKTDLSQSFSHAFGNGGAKELTKLGDSIKDVASDSSSAIPALTGLASKIAGLASGGGGGAGGLIGGAVSLLGGLFEEGGLSGSAVTSAVMPASYWAGAPAYAEGTVNTSRGHPAILHDNEAVIPLSRGREIPVDLKGAGGGGDSHVHNHIAVNVAAKDHDSFRLNKNQIAAAMHRETARMNVRNN